MENQWIQVQGMKVRGGSRCDAAFIAVFFWLTLSLAIAQPTPGTVFTIDASAPIAVPETGYLQMGSLAANKSPLGHTLSVNSRYLILDGKPWLPVMGEFHYSRYPERYWEEEVLKMKAGGVQIVSTYVFWIHQEEVEGQFDWSGQRDLRKFVELCAKHGLYVYPRIGPWAHGEARNGGLPDWLMAKGPTRVNDPVYLSYVQRYYSEIGRQLKGLLWKDGGPIIGIQVENEYSNRAQNAGAAHISKLKSMAVDVGLDLPLYTVTGWDNAVYPVREVTPVFGGYPDEAWSGSREQLPPDTQSVYQFHVTPTSGNAGIMQGLPTSAEGVELWHYPRFTAELGGGMQVTYHRRVVIEPKDILPMAIAQIGAGVNLLGYYMFQGGANPQHKLTTLQESQATDYPNDVPVKSYDFQAPLREFGQVNGSFRKIKVIHQFLADFGSYLAPMRAVLPDTVPSGPRDTTTLRVAARTQGDHGFVFFSNYVRNYPMPEHKAVQVTLKLPSEALTLPHRPIDIPSQSSFLWPVNLDLNGALLKYSTAQPFATIEDGKLAYYFFETLSGVVSEFAFAAETVESLDAKNGTVSRQDGRVYVDGLPPSTGVAIAIQTHAGRSVRIVLLSEQQAQNSWKFSSSGHERLLMTPADVFFSGDDIDLRSHDAAAFSFSILPDADRPITSTAPLRKTGSDGAFAGYAAAVEPKRIQVSVEKTRDASPSSPVKMGRRFDWRPGPVASSPDDSDFEKAAVWRLTMPKNALDGLSDLFLGINYVGDVGRLYEGSRLLDDNFFNGTTWEVGLKQFAPEALAKGVELKILPLREDAPIYLPKAAWPEYNETSERAEVKAISISPEYEVRLTIQPNPPN